MGSTKKIIIIDDDDMLRDTLKEQFSLHDEFVVAEPCQLQPPASRRSRPIMPIW